MLGTGDTETDQTLPSYLPPYRQTQSLPFSCSLCWRELCWRELILPTSLWRFLCEMPMDKGGQEKALVGDWKVRGREKRGDFSPSFLLWTVSLDGSTSSWVTLASGDTTFFLFPLALSVMEVSYSFSSLGWLNIPPSHLAVSPFLKPCNYFPY